MSLNDNLKKAKEAKNDEFYTQYVYIQKEVNAYLEYNADLFKNKTVLLPCDDPEWSNFTKFFAQNFEKFGLKKLISTSYAYNSKNVNFDYQPTLFESIDPRFEVKKSKEKGKIFTLTSDENKDGKINIDDLKWNYLEGDGDFRSEEIIKLRNEADIIITNPPFSLFREFIAWLVESKKQFLIIGNQNAVTYKEVFPLIKDNNMWIGATNNGVDMVFEVPDLSVIAKKDNERAEKLGYKGNYTRMGNSCWFTNIEHGRRHQKLNLMTFEDNIKFNKTLKKKMEEFHCDSYPKYDNYDAIEVPKYDCIPSNYDGIMAVPITFLDKYCPEQFELLGITQRNDDPYKIKSYTKEEYKNANDLNARGVIIVDGVPKSMYARVLIKRK